MIDTIASSRILTLVFTDLADSTALKMARGDHAVGELIERHRAIVRRVAAESGGRIDEARAAIAEGRRVRPDLSIEIMQNYLAVSRPEIDARRNAALREAGLE